MGALRRLAKTEYKEEEARKEIGSNPNKSKKLEDKKQGGFHPDFIYGGKYVSQTTMPIPKHRNKKLKGYQK